MTNPFPGVDPYLEESGLWRDFHQRFITVLADMLLPALPEGYDARSEEQIQLIEVEPDRTHKFLPDVGVTHDPSLSRSPTGSGTAVLERPGVKPVTVRTPALVEERERWIEILVGEHRELVTVIELLSPSNKVGSGRRKYRRKREILLARHVNLVEIDLLLEGRRVATAKDPFPPGDFFAYVSRASRMTPAGGECQVHAWSLRDPLPAIPIPLAPPAVDVAIDLAEVFSTTYDRGRYARAFRRVDLPMKIRPADEAWAEVIVEKAGLVKR